MRAETGTAAITKKAMTQPTTAPALKFDFSVNTPVVILETGKETKYAIKE